MTVQRLIALPQQSSNSNSKQSKAKQSSKQQEKIAIADQRWTTASKQHWLINKKEFLKKSHSKIYCL
ncbi:hypothetical protein T07_10726 [Trichinella nelsoni]|uniref:Uncharacterized protein n=1 Tax=Trichinella nelsoni TaxID=6336 RepID=A0A0V0SIX3_9BILA|nr:hypothetical protein T07_10726 [Trichinella nelsoni]